MSTNTIAALLAFIGIGAVPKVPWYAKLVLQVILGVLIYNVWSDVMFDLPMGDDSPISSIFGGDGGMGDFNKYSMGVLGTVIGFITTSIFSTIYGLLGRSKED